MDIRPFIVGNWKMNGTRASLAEARAIDRVASRFPKVEVGIAPPFTLVHATRDAVESIRVGGQDCHYESDGAFTGDISAPILQDAGADFTILGHSERRDYHVESDELVRRKSEAAREAGLGVILCVGESEDIRDSGAAIDFVTTQLAASAPQTESAAEKLSVAYEPIWAIGTGRVPSIEDIGEMHRAIRHKLTELYGDSGKAIRILYGGSVKAENAAELLAADEVGGALVGGASLSNESFGGIIMAAAAMVEEAA